MDGFQNVTIVIPDDDKPITLDFKDEARTFNPVKGLLVVIEYIDRDGYFSRRKIQMMRISRQWGNDVLYAFCLTANGFRSFICTSIHSFITADGEVITPTQFWNDLGINPQELARNDPKALNRHAGSILGPELIVLAGLSESDGDMRRSELDAIIDYTEVTLEDEGIILTPDECVALRKYIRRLGPTAETIATAADILLNRTIGKNHSALSQGRRRRFLYALNEVMTADGVLHEREFAFLADLQHHFRPSDH